MASMECEGCSKAKSDQEGRCLRMWHEVQGDTMPPHEPLSVPGFSYECTEEQRARLAESD